MLCCIALVGKLQGVAAKKSIYANWASLQLDESLSSPEGEAMERAKCELGLVINYYTAPCAMSACSFSPTLLTLSRFSISYFIHSVPISRPLIFVFHCSVHSVHRGRPADTTACMHIAHAAESGFMAACAKHYLEFPCMAECEEIFFVSAVST